MQRRLDWIRLLCALLSLSWLVWPVARDQVGAYELTHLGWPDATSIDHAAGTIATCLSGVVWAALLLFARRFPVRILLIICSVASTLPAIPLFVIVGACFFGDCSQKLPAWGFWAVGLAGVWLTALAELLRPLLESARPAAQDLAA